jgi:hypothetical protein
LPGEITPQLVYRKVDLGSNQLKKEGNTMAKKKEKEGKKDPAKKKAKKKATAKKKGKKGGKGKK